MMAAADKKKGEGKKSEKVVVTPELRRIWITARKAWVTSYDSFHYTLSALSTKQADSLYDIVRVSLYRGSFVEILREHPELREMLKSDDDRICMHDIYESLSWRLGRKEEPPQDVKLKMGIKGRIGRMAPDLSA